MNRGVFKRYSRPKTEPKKRKDVQELMAPKNREIKEKPMNNRCCYFNSESESPVPDDCHCTKDFGQIVEMPPDDVTVDRHTDQYQQILREQYGFDPGTKISQQRMEQLKGIIKTLCTAVPKVENSSQYANPKMTPSFVETSDGTQWMNVDNADDIDRMIGGATVPSKEQGTRDTSPTTFIWPKARKNRKISPTRDVHISETPRVKIIAEKFAKIKRNNIEIRKLEEKVVCVEYDVFASMSQTKPIQRLRAFFSIKPLNISEDKKAENIERKESKNKFLIAEEDLKRLTDKEIEIIDGKISENQSYLKDLRHVLRRQKIVSERRNRSKLDLSYLYDLAVNDGLRNDSKVNFLSKGELKEVKDLILNRCTSSVYGFNRHRVSPTDKTDLVKGASFMSQSFFNEILRESGVGIA